MTNAEPRQSAIPNRFFFSTTRDLYFLTYMTALCVRETQTSKAGLADARKLPFLIPFVSDARLTDIARRRREELPISLDDRIRIHSAETQGRRLRPLVHRLIFSLSQRGLLDVAGDSPASTELRIASGSPLDELAAAEVFQYERQNLRKLRSVLQLRRATLDTVRKRLFFLEAEL